MMFLIALAYFRAMFLVVRGVAFILGVALGALYRAVTAERA